MTEFLKNLCATLAHTLLLESKEREPLGDSWVLNEGDNYPGRNEMPSLALGLTRKQFPKWVSTMLGQIPAIDAATLASAERTTPALNTLQANEYSRIAPQLAAAGASADNIGRMAGAEGDLSILNGPGGQMVTRALQLDQQANPEYYAARSAVGAAIPGLVSGGLSGGETEAITRSLNRSNNARGLMETPTPLSTVSNAMTYGNAARQRQMEGIGAANAFMPASRTGFDAVQTALGRPSTNAGAGQFLGVQPGSGTATFGLGTNMYNQQAQMAQTYGTTRANARDTGDRLNDVGTVAASAC